MVKRIKPVDRLRITKPDTCFYPKPKIGKTIAKLLFFGIPSCLIFLLPISKTSPW